MRVLRKKPDILVSATSPRGNPEFRAVLAKRALALGLTLSPDQVQITHGCMEALNLALRAVAWRAHHALNGKQTTARARGVKSQGFQSHHGWFAGFCASAAPVKRQRVEHLA